LKTRILLGAAVVVAALAVIGCGGGSLCGTAQDAWANLNRKSAPCGYNALNFNRTTCDQNVSGCNDSDKNIADAYFTCLNKVGTCDPNNPDPFAAAVNACGRPTVSSDQCVTAINAQ
jgi:hypothetical protein